jgi:5-methylcytosine-specific restriction endonuclease McrA
MVDGEVAVRTGRSARAKVWRTKDGRRIPLREMGDQHLTNAMVYLRRAHQRYVESIVFLGIPVDIGEFAREAAEQEMVEALESKVDEIYPIYDPPGARQVRRGRPRREGPRPPCAIDACSTVAVARGLCDRHYRKLLKSEGRIRDLHGESGKTPEYFTWMNLRQRGGACEDWQSYDTFLRDMGRRPTGHVLRRKDTYKPWSKNNCLWSTSRSMAVSARMRLSRTQRERVVVDGETLYQCGGECGRFLSASEFHKKDESVIGIRSLCKRCHQIVVIRTRDPKKLREGRVRCEARRRARKVGVVAEVFSKQFQALMTMWGAACLKCGSVHHLAWDHVIPLARGGPHVVTNLQRLCRGCNSRKRTDVADYRSAEQIEWAKNLEAA